MDRYVLFVMSRARDGREAEYHRWYDEQHLADVCAIPGVKSARRFDCQQLPAGSPPLPFAATYELETDDPHGILAEIRRRARTDQMPVSDALDGETTTLWLLKQR